MLKYPVMAYVIKDKLHFLYEASTLLSSSLDYNATLTRIAKLVVNNIADFCIIDLLQKNGTMQRVAVRVSDPRKQQMANVFFDLPPDPRNKEAIYDVARTGRPILIKKATTSWLKNVSKLPEEHSAIKNLSLNSHIFVPLKSRGKVIGVLTFASNKRDFSYDMDDLLLAEDLAARAGIAVDKAMLYFEAQEAIRARDEFISIASHELKTPLTAIILHLGESLRRIRKSSKEQTKAADIEKLLEICESQANRLSRLINDLLNMSVITTGRLKLEKEKVNLTNIVKDILTQFKPQLKKSKIQVVLTGENSVTGLWDKVRLEQVISNLISNALKYGRGNPITIKLKKGDRKAVLYIKDKGIGIREEEQQYLFDLFTRGTSAREYFGQGIGLYISRQIIEAHKGTLSLQSKEGVGSTFTIELPL